MNEETRVIRVKASPVVQARLDRIKALAELPSYSQVIREALRRFEDDLNVANRQT